MDQQSLIAVTPSEKAKPPKPGVVMMQEQLVARYEPASPEDKAAAAALVARARGAGKSAEVIRTPPGMCACLFFDNNRQNRSWKWTVTRNYLEEIRAGDWKFTSQGLGMLVTGDVGDGQHRLAACALSGETLEFVVAFGMEVSAIPMLDSGANRQAADDLHILTHTSEPSKKAALVKRAFTYLAKARPGSAPPHFNYRIANLVRQHHAMIVEAMQLGRQSVVGIVKPTLASRSAQDVVFVLLLSGWPKAVIVDKLALFQRGEDVGENSPFFVTAQLLDKQAKTDRTVTPSVVCALTVRAFQYEEQGIKAVKKAVMKAVMEPKNFPDPTYKPATTAATV